MELRDYQLRAVESPGRRLIIVSPCGSGKSIILTELARRSTERVLILAHRTELLEQLSGRVGTPHGCIWPGGRADDQRVQIASVQTLARRGERPVAGLVILDEAHHAPARTFGALLGAYPDARHVGLTATPYRLDGKGLGQQYDEIYVAATMGDLVEAGHLVRPRYFTPHVPDLGGVHHVGGDFVARQAAAQMSKITGDIVATWKRLGEGRRTIVMASNVPHAEELARAFGLGTAHIEAETPTADRKEIIRRFAGGELKILVNVNLVVEGFDVPDVGCVVWARPTMSRQIWVQGCGRALRPAEGKVDALIIDHADNFRRHGDLLWDESYDLQMGLTVVGATPGSIRMCRSCFGWSKSGDPVCSSCGAPWPRVRVPRAAYGELGEVTDLEKTADYRRWVGEAKARGFEIGWAAVRFKDKYGDWPTPEMKAGAETSSEYLSRMLRTATERGFKEGWAGFRFKARFGRWPSFSERKAALDTADGSRR